MLLEQWEQICQSKMYRKIDEYFQRDMENRIQEAKTQSAQSTTVEMLFAQK